MANLVARNVRCHSTQPLVSIETEERKNSKEQAPLKHGHLRNGVGRMLSPCLANLESFFLCLLVYAMSSSNIIQSLVMTLLILDVAILEGKSVQVLANGAVHPARTVTNGAITLDTPANKVQIGLGYNSDLQTLPLAFDGAPAGGQGFTKNINKVAMRVTNSSLVKAGPSFAKLTEYPARDVTDPYGSPPTLKTGELRFAVGPSWNSDGMICVRQDQPLPLTIMSMALDVATGG